MSVTRRRLLEIARAIATACFAVRRPLVSEIDLTDAPDTSTVDAEPLTLGTQPTKLERFLRSRGIKPAHLARESGYSRQFLLGLRMGHILPRKHCAFAISAACERFARERVRPLDLFDVWLPNNRNEEE
jgi:hypothetical protein